MIKTAVELLNSDFIVRNCENPQLNIEFFESIGSTSDYLRAQAPTLMPQICIAEQQAEGHGRQGRKWHSPLGENIYLSCRYVFPKDINNLAGLSLVVGLAAIKAIEALYPQVGMMAKWPNDLVYGERKLAGILLDAQANPIGGSVVIIGVGINANMMADEDAQISQPWTSLRKIINRDVDRNMLTVELINTLLRHLDLFCTHSFEYFHEEWRELDYLFNREVCMQMGEKQVFGLEKGVDEYGRLLLELENETIQAFASGEAFIVKNLKKS